MPRPRKSTKDEWLDQFADWDSETQEDLLDTCALLHRQTKRREAKAVKTAPDYVPGTGEVVGLAAPSLFIGAAIPGVTEAHESMEREA